MRNPGLASAELYDPAVGVFSFTGSMSYPRRWATATTLQNGKVVVVGAIESSNYLVVGNIQGPNYSILNGPVELYDPDLDTFLTIDADIRRIQHTATLLDNGEVLIAGGTQDGSYGLASAFRAKYLPPSVIDGILTVPQWLNAQNLSVAFGGTSSPGEIKFGSVSSDKINWSEWISVSAGTIPVATLDFGVDGVGKPLYLRLQDGNGQIAEVVTATVNIDRVAPTSTIEYVSSSSLLTVDVSWSAKDSVSGVASYDIDVGEGDPESWVPLFSGTEVTQTVFTGSPGITYYFRIRALDHAGNLELWHEIHDAQFTFPYVNFLPVLLNPPPPSHTGNIRITSIFYEGIGESEPDEYVELQNADSKPIQLDNWTLRDDSQQVFRFPNYVIQPGQICRVYTNEFHPDWCGFNFRSSTAIWNNEGDCAFLKNAVEAPVAYYCYP